MGDRTSPPYPVIVPDDGEGVLVSPTWPQPVWLRACPAGEGDAPGGIVYARELDDGTNPAEVALWAAQGALDYEAIRPVAARRVRPQEGEDAESWAQRVMRAVLFQSQSRAVSLADGESWPPIGPPDAVAERRRRSLRTHEDVASTNRARTRELRRRQADMRARALLFAHLSDEEKDRWRRETAIHVTTHDGMREYRLDGTLLSGNVELVRCEDGAHGPRGDVLRPGRRYCIHVVENVPYADNVLTQKLMLETPGGVDRFHELANPM